MTTQAMSGLRWLDPLADAGLLPKECRDVEIDLPVNGVGTIIYTCNLTPDIVAALNLAPEKAGMKP